MKIHQGTPNLVKFQQKYRASMKKVLSLPATLWRPQKHYVRIKLYQAVGKTEEI
jgi:hypothetical protein